MRGKGPVWALGAMSGTSLDGVDAALLRTDGETIHGFGESGYRRYSPAERAVLRAALGCWDGPVVAAAAEVVETAHAELLSRFPDCDIVGFHGQTLAHDPRGRGTLQVGDGGLLAEVLGKTVVWDFRSTDVQMGGEGAPLAPFYHFACARWIKADGPLAILNLGGVGNLTWIDPGASGPEGPGALLAFDTGPANAPIDDIASAQFSLPYDEDGRIAARGAVNEAVIESFSAHPYFNRMPPKSLDRDAWGGLVRDVARLDGGDAIATLTAAVVQSVVLGMELCPSPPARVLVTGGGRRNTVLMGWLGAALGVPVDPVESVGLDGDMLEAQAFAHLAVRVARGLPTSTKGTTGVGAPVGGGIVSRP